MAKFDSESQNNIAYSVKNVFSFIFLCFNWRKLKASDSPESLNNKFIAYQKDTEKFVKGSDLASIIVSIQELKALTSHLYKNSIIKDEEAQVSEVAPALKDKVREPIKLQINSELE